MASPVLAASASWLIATLAIAASPPDDCIARDGSGEAFPTCFDPGRGLELGGAYAHRFLDTVDAPGSGGGLQLHAAILWRTARASRSRERSLWIMEHRFLATRGQPQPGRRELTFTLWEGTFRRHVEEGFILVPTRRPLRLPFPFDVALHVRAGTWERRLYEGPGARVEVLQAALLLDPVRSTSGRFRLGLGPAMGYTLRSGGSPGGGEGLSGWAHELSPFTSGLVDASLESADGWWSFRLNAVAGWVLIPGQQTYFRARGEAHLERLLLALNDQPLWLRAFARAAERDAGVHRRSEVVVGAGLVLRGFN